MARAHRHYHPGLVWHITQRCHDQEFLLKFQHYRKRWLYWAYQAKLRFSISILDYVVTSNHIHLLALCDGKENDIARTFHLVSGRTAWEFNQKRRRKGSFWEDRYHATVVETDSHFIRCMIYIDMNMVRAGVVKHPEEWTHCGYQELSGGKQRYSLIDKDRLYRILGTNEKDFPEMYNMWTNEYLNKKKYQRESCWTESLAVGSQDYLEKIKEKLGTKVYGRHIVKNSGSYELKEEVKPYLRFYPPENLI